MLKLLLLRVVAGHFTTWLAAAASAGIDTVPSTLHVYFHLAWNQSSFSQPSSTTERLVVIANAIDRDLKAAIGLLDSHQQCLTCPRRQVAER